MSMELWKCQDVQYICVQQFERIHLRNKQHVKKFTEWLVT